VSLEPLFESVGWKGFGVVVALPEWQPMAVSWSAISVAFDAFGEDFEAEVAAQVR